MEWPQGLRPCHDLRVAGATNELLADVVFADEAAALERRMPLD